jgi:outer membrane protein assembly factor BamB
MSYRLAFITFFFPITVLIAGGNWPQFRGPSGNGHAEVKTAPIRWSETENIRWKTPIHGKGWSSPVIWGDQIWMTTALENGKERFAVCVDRQSGKIIHDLKLLAEENPPFCIPYNSYASSTPVIEAGRVYIHFGSSLTTCLDTGTGRVVWERRDLPCDHFRGPGSSPILHGNLLLLTFDGFDRNYLVGLDKANGKTVWKTDRNIKYSTPDGDYHKAYSTPSLMEVDGKLQLVSPSAEATIAYDPDTGKELWQIHHGGMNAACRPIFGHGLVFLTSGHTAHLLAVRQGGSGDVTADGVVWQAIRNVPTRPSLLLVGDLLFMVGDKGIASCLEAKTGKQLWSERLGSVFSASPTLAAGNIYFADEEGKTHVVAAEPTFKVLATNKLDDGCMASPAFVDDMLYLRTRTHLYSIGVK